MYWQSQWTFWYHQQQLSTYEVLVYWSTFYDLSICLLKHIMNIKIDILQIHMTTPHHTCLYLFLSLDRNSWSLAWFPPSTWWFWLWWDRWGLESVNLVFPVVREAVSVGFTVSAVISGLLVTAGFWAQGWLKGQGRCVGTGYDPGPRRREQKQ